MMKTQRLVFLTIFGAIFASVAFGYFAAVRPASNKRANGLVARLPESDVVALMDGRRFFDHALPKVLSANQSALGKIVATLDQIQQRTGIDLRKFDQIAVGAAMSRRTASEVDLDTVVLAQGVYNSGALLSIVKIASDGVYREENIGGRTVYIFSARDVARKNAPKVSGSTIGSAIERAVNGMGKEVAVTSLDASTVAFGSPDRVRQTIEAKTAVSPDITALLSPHAVVSFAARTPDGMSRLLPLDNDELGKNLDAIRYLAGSMDVGEGLLSAHLLARAAKPELAQGLADTLQGLQMLGKNLLGGSKRPDQLVLARTIGSAKIARTGNDVTLDLSVPQSDIDLLIAAVR